jgi:hypothetical protein
MLRSVKTLSAIILLSALMLLGVGQQISQSLKVTCTNEERARLLAPGGEHAAVMFLRDCGPDTGISLQVSIMRAERETSNLPGNVLATDQVEPDYALNWVDAHTLEIGNVTGQVIRQREQLDDFTIRYAP